MKLQPIGFFHCNKKHPYEAPRQARLNKDNQIGFIQLLAKNNFEQALKGLEEFSHIWIVYQFHQKDNWKPMVMPPRGTDTKKGIFATRSPYRPNPIGMSAVKLEKIHGLKIYVKEFDLLDGTPILDIKPYLKYSDSITKSNLGWIKPDEYKIKFSKKSKEQILFLKEHGVSEIEEFIINQLSNDPINKKKKRVSKKSSGQFILAYQTWRVLFKLNQSKNISILEISSGYSEKDLSNYRKHLSIEKLQTDLDPYQDKIIHVEFTCQKF